MARQSLYDYKKDGILDSIRRLTAVRGRSPSLREIAGVTDCSVATLHSYLIRLRDEGLVEWSERHHRSLKVVNRPAPLLRPAPPAPTGSTQTGSGPTVSHSSNSQP